MVAIADTDGNGTIEFPELLTLMEQFTVRTTFMDEMKKAFRHFDKVSFFINYKKKERGGVRKKVREIQREKNKEREKQRERQRVRETERQRDRKAERQRETVKQ